MKLFLLGMDHECATRVPDKPLRPFAGTTLFDIYLKKFKALQDCDLFSGQGIALWKGDKRLWAKAEEAGVPIVERSEASAKGHGDYKVIFEFLKDVDAEWILRVSCCAPFLAVGSLVDMVRNWHQIGDDPIFGVRTLRQVATCQMVRKWCWSSTGRMIGARATTSQDMDCIAMCTHGGLLFERDVLVQTGWPWTEALMGWLPVGVREAIDIDTKEDFDLARRIAGSFTEEEWKALYSLPTG